MRVDEAQRLLRSSRVLTIDAKSTGGSEADILKDCQTKLLYLAQRYKGKEQDEKKEEHLQGENNLIDTSLCY